MAFTKEIGPPGKEGEREGSHWERNTGWWDSGTRGRQPTEGHPECGWLTLHLAKEHVGESRTQTVLATWDIWQRGSDLSTTQTRVSFLHTQRPQKVTEPYKRMVTVFISKQTRAGF